MDETIANQIEPIEKHCGVKLSGKVRKKEEYDQAMSLFGLQEEKDGE